VTEAFNDWIFQFSTLISDPARLLTDKAFNQVDFAYRYSVVGLTVVFRAASGMNESVRMVGRYQDNMHYTCQIGD
jgi:hypothetical protein